ncbi:VTT domain-containing protein [Macrococcus lamae]|uniref:Cytochrome O ubiquinol oxidase n=1 Tax=Macrococcus lamae TaxID=198484 RepID=A0A4R6BS33_9STAP|nr:VTT domain-containing protein [Macrococcus lamae]TDM05208.1 cytochrome O ubiquinol oxidase [Macrococcus lamae]
MSLITHIIDFMLHIDQYLIDIVKHYGTLTYGILFLMIFMETGFVVTPFLPGDSLLFAAAALAPQHALNIWLLFIVCTAGAIIGDTVNYHIGRAAGTGITRSPRVGRFVKEEHMTKATEFFNRYGGKTIIMARFMPMIRTFIPFVAGASHMKYRDFITYNIIGAAVWVAVCLCFGFFFGNIKIVKDNFEIVLILIIVISLLPAVISGINAWRHNRNHNVK